MDKVHKVIEEGLTFDDVLIMPTKSEVLPRETSIVTKLTRKIELNAPIVSAAMDTVTESAMAVAISRQGGIGIIHKNMSIEAQANEVDRVKRSEHGVITDPFSLSPNHYVFEANELMAKYHISGVPITENNKLVGIITNRDLRFETNHKKKIYEVMTREGLITAPEGTTLSQAKEILTIHKIEKLPMVDEHGKLKGLITIKDIEKTIKYPHSAKDEFGRLLVGAAVTVSEDLMERVDALINAKVDVLMIDVSNAHNTSVSEAIKNIKSAYPNMQIIAGSVATADGAKFLIDAGADAIKVGMGAGSASMSRIISGVGVPQISAIIACAQVAREFSVPIISDGGIRFSGDFTKAIAAGASTCMIGSLLAACEESPSKMELYQGRKYKVYRGNAALYDETPLEHKTAKDYFNDEIAQSVPEGVSGRVSYKGKIGDVVYQLLGGLRLGMAYCGAKNIDELYKNSRFIRVSLSSLKEGHPHNIQITTEAPNYSVEY